MVRRRIARIIDTVGHAIALVRRVPGPWGLAVRVGKLKKVQMTRSVLDAIRKLQPGKSFGDETNTSTYPLTELKCERVAICSRLVLPAVLATGRIGEHSGRGRGEDESECAGGSGSRELHVIGTSLGEVRP